MNAETTPKATQDPGSQHRNPGHLAARIFTLVLLILASAPWTFSQIANRRHTLTLAANKDSVVRFFFVPAHDNYFHVALLFRGEIGGGNRGQTGRFPR